MNNAESSKIFMFAGKGGVGKTTCAATVALHHALTGEKTLAISTDATPSLSHIFEISDPSKPARVTDNLFVNELGEEEIREMWDRKFGREVYEVFSTFVAIDYPEFVEFMTSLLPGLSNEFMIDYIRELNLNDEYETIVWDTAPLGQTLALLKTPAMLSQHLSMAPRIYSRLKFGKRSRAPILDIIKRWEILSAANMEFLKKEVRFTMVTIAEALAIEQFEAIFSELNEHELKVQQLIINNIIKEEDPGFLLARAGQQRGYINSISSKYPNLKTVELPMFPHEIKGIERLKEVEKALFSDNRFFDSTPSF